MGGEGEGVAYLRQDARKASGSSAVVKSIPVTVLSFDMNTQFP